MSFAEGIQTFWDECLIFVLVLLLTRHITRLKKELGADYDHTDWKAFIPGSILLSTFVLSTIFTANAFFNAGLAGMWLNGSHLFLWSCCYIYASKDIQGLLNAVRRFIYMRMTTFAAISKTVKKDEKPIQKEDEESEQSEKEPEENSNTK